MSSRYEKLKEMKSKAAAKGELENKIAGGETTMTEKGTSADSEAQVQKAVPATPRAVEPSADPRAQDAKPAGKPPAKRPAKPRATKTLSEEPTSQKKSAKQKQVPDGNINVWIDGTVVDAFDEYLFNANRKLRQRKEPKLTRKGVIENLLRQMLDM